MLYRNLTRRRNIEAIQWNGANTDEVLAFCGEGKAKYIPNIVFGKEYPGGNIKILYGHKWISISKGNYIIKDEGGHLYKCGSLEFEGRNVPVKEEENKDEI